MMVQKRTYSVKLERIHYYELHYDKIHYESYHNATHDNECVTHFTVYSRSITIIHCAQCTSSESSFIEGWICMLHVSPSETFSRRYLIF